MCHRAAKSVWHIKKSEDATRACVLPQGPRTAKIKILKNKIKDTDEPPDGRYIRKGRVGSSGQAPISSAGLPLSWKLSNLTYLIGVSMGFITQA